MKINNTEYTTPTLNFSNTCKLEQWGIDMASMASKPLTLLAGFVALTVGGKSLEDGEAAVDAHLASGGKLDDITTALNEAIESSGFFKATAEQTAKT